MKAIFTNNITDKIINYSQLYNYDVKLLKPVESKFHNNFCKYLNYKDFLNYKNVIVVTDDVLLNSNIFNFHNEDSIGVLKDTYSNSYSNISPFVKCIYKEYINSNSINTDIVIYNNVSQFVGLFHRIENFCKFVDKPYLFNLSGIKTATPNFLNPGLERELFNYFCMDMYKDFNLYFL